MEMNFLFFGTLNFNQSPFQSKLIFITFAQNTKKYDPSLGKINNQTSPKDYFYDCDTCKQ